MSKSVSTPKQPPLPAKSLLWVAPAAISAGLLASSVYLFSQDLTGIAHSYQDTINEAAGFPVNIAGPIALDYDGGLKVTTRNITVPNADWGQAEQFGKVEQVIATLDLAPLLTGTVALSQVDIQGADISLEENETGAQNWVVETGTTDTAPSQARTQADTQPITLPNITLSNVRLHYHDLAIDQTQEIHIAEGRLQTAGAVTAFETQGTYNDSPYQTAGTVTALTDLLSGKSATLDVTSKLDADEVTIKGSIDSIANNVFNLNVSGNVADVPALLAITKNRVDLPITSVQVSGNIASKRDTIDLKGIQLALDDSAITGNLSIVQGETLNISGDIEADILDLNRFLTETASKETATEASDKNQIGETNATEKTARVFSADPLPVDNLRTITGDLSVRANKVLYDKLTLTNLASTVSAQDGIVKTDSTTFGLGSGNFKGALTFDLNDIPSLALDANVTGVDLGALLTELGTDDTIAGQTNLAITLKGQGDSPAKIAESLNGNTELIIQDGNVKSGLIDFLAADFFRALASSVGSEATPLQCVVSRFDIANGIATSNVFLMETDLIQITGDGTVDFSTEEIDLSLHPRAQDLSIMNFEFDYAIGGTLAAPSYAPKATSVALSIAKTAAGTALTGGLGTIGSNVATGVLKSGLGKEELCQQAIDGTFEEVEAPVEDAGEGDE